MNNSIWAARLHGAVKRVAVNGPYKNESIPPIYKEVCMWWDRSSTVFWALQCPLVEGVWHYYTAELEEPKTCSYMNEDSVTNLTQDDFQRLLQERITYGSRLQHIYGLDFPLLPV